MNTSTVDILRLSTGNIVAVQLGNSYVPCGIAVNLSADLALLAQFFIPFEKDLQHNSYFFQVSLVSISTLYYRYAWLSLLDARTDQLHGLVSPDTKKNFVTEVVVIVSRSSVVLM